MHFISIIIIVFIFNACSVADIRPEGFNPNEPESEQIAKWHLSKMQDAHGGKEAWLNKKYAVYQLRDFWPSWVLRTLVMPWDFSGQKIKITSSLGDDNGRLEFLEGESLGSSWGIQNWATYHKLNNNSVEFIENDKIKFWIPTLKYFAELPFRIHEAPLVRYIGRSFRHEKQYHKIYATWHSLEPNSTYDQYVLWINTQSYLVDYVEYTVRDMMASAKGILFYYDYRDIDGIKVPFGMRVLDDPDDNNSVMHDMVLKSVYYTDKIETAYIFPQPDKKANKH